VGSLAVPFSGWAIAVVAAGIWGGPFIGSTQAADLEDFLSHDFGGFLVQPQLDLGSSYTDNLTFTEGAGQISDIQGTISPGLRVRRGEITGNFINLEATHDEMLFLDHSDFNYRQNRFKGNGVLRTARTRLEASENYEMLSGFLGGIEGQSGAINNAPRDRTVWSGSWRATYDWTDRTDVYADFGHYVTDWSKDVFLYDFNTLRGALGASYEFTGRIRLFSEVFYGQTGVSANQVGQPKGEPSALFGTFVGARGQFTERFSGTGKVGVENRSFFEPGRASVIIPAFDLDLRYQLTDTIALALVYSRRTSPSLNFGGQNATSDMPSFTATRVFGSSGQWTMRGTTSYQRVDYSNSSAPNQPSTARKDDLLSAELNLAYQPRPWLTVSGGYAFENYSVDFANPLLYLRNLTGYQANRVFVNLSLGF